MIEETLCPDCGGKMVSRKNVSTGQRFWGCKDYPKCRGTRNTDGEAKHDEMRSGADDDTFAPSERQRNNDRGRWRNQ